MLIIQSGSSIGADVKDNTEDQVYVAGSEYPTTTAAIDYVGSLGLQNSDGNIFETQYLASSNGQYCGIVDQNGTQTLATWGYTYQNILHYYYDYLIKSTGAITFFNY